MDSTKYIGMDVHKEAITIAVLNSSGKLVMESIVETKAATILEFFHGLSGESCRLPLKKGPGLPGCTTCCGPTSHRSRCAIRGRPLY